MSSVTTNNNRSGLAGVRVRRLLSAIAIAISACFDPVTVASAMDGIELASVHATVGDLRTGKVLYAKRDDFAVPIASITKLMTAMVALDAGQPLDEWISIVGRKDTHGKNGYSRLRPGSQATRGQLLRLMLMASEK